MEHTGTTHYIQAGARAMEWHRQNIRTMRRCRFDTIAVHGIYSMQEALDFNQGSMIEPIYMSTAQGYRDADEMEAALSYRVPTWCYARIANPTMYYYEGVLALLESYGSDVEASCIGVASGMAAFQSGVYPFVVIDREGGAGGPAAPINFVASAQVYGGTFQQFAMRKEQDRGIEWRRVHNSNDLEEWASRIDANTRFLYAELPSNPSLGFFDIARVADLAHEHGLPLIVDSTVATPALLRPLEHGVDIVVQSVTKSLAGGGMGIAGAVIARKNIPSRVGPEEMKADFCAYLKLLPNRDNGPNISPMNAILALNDIRTIRSRMDQVSRNTMLVAEFLSGHKHVESVEYLGLEEHPLHELASRYMFLVDAEHDDLYRKPVNRYGHLMSITVKGEPQRARDVFDGFQRVWRATDLGRVKSVATIPAISTHQQQGEENRKVSGISPSLIRLCVGAEHPDDVIADLSRALDVLDGKKISVTFPEYSAGGASSATLRRG